MKISKLFLVIVLSLVIFIGCDDNKEITPQQQQIVLRDYQTQYNVDILKIENYLKTHSVSVINNSGFVDDQDATFTSVSNLNPNSIWGTDPLTPKTSLLTKTATIGGVIHKIYYIKFRLGNGASPTLVSQIKSQYKGFLIEDGSIFDSSPTTGSQFTLNQLIFGWREILPEFKMGSISGVNQYSDFGSGVMFLPSALAYYEQSRVPIPQYSPLAFSFKLFNVI